MAARYGDLAYLSVHSGPCAVLVIWEPPLVPGAPVTSILQLGLRHDYATLRVEVIIRIRVIRRLTDIALPRMSVLFRSWARLGFG